MNAPSFLTRREVLKLGAAAAAGAATLPLVSYTKAEALSSTKPLRIIFMVSDGMSMGVPTLTEAFSQLIGRGETHWHALARKMETVHGFFDMASLNSLVTDSSAASSSWGSGSRITNHSINVLPDGTHLQPLARSVKESGRAMGLVTTVTITHATPAGFASSVVDRNDELSIATQYLDQVDVLLGGGLRFFEKSRRPDKRNLLGEYRKAGYAILDRRDQLAAARGEKKILGLFDSHFLPFTLDWKNNEAMQKKVPTLAEMSSLALHSLNQHAEGFLLQIEAGRVDGAAHANDPAAILWDQLAFDDALGVVLEFIRGNPETLLIVTTDHGNSNPGLNGMGAEYAKSNETFARLRSFQSSTLVMESELKLLRDTSKIVSPNNVLARIKAGTALSLSAEEGQALADALSGKPPKLGNQQHANFVGLLAEFTGNYTGIGWTGTTHTADFVPILATGPGAEGYHGLVLNTASYPHLTSLMGVPHRNPSMTPEAARQYEKVARQSLPHWIRQSETVA